MKSIPLVEMDDIKDLTVSEILESFPLLIDQRVSTKRKDTNFPLSEISKYVAACIVHMKAPYLRDILSDHIEEILDDCEIYFNMPREKAYDARNECSQLAFLYVNDGENIRIYERICKIIADIRVSYPITFLSDNNNDTVFD